LNAGCLGRFIAWFSPYGRALLRQEIEGIRTTHREAAEHFLAGLLLSLFSSGLMATAESDMGYSGQAGTS